MTDVSGQATRTRGAGRPRRLTYRFARVLAPILIVAGCREHSEPSAPSEPMPALNVTAAHTLGFRQVSAGALNHACGVTTDDAAYCWGDGSYGQLGNGTSAGPEECLFGDCTTRSVRVVSGLAFRSVSVGREHTCGVTTTSVAYCWGLNNLGQLGIGHTTGPETCNFTPCSTRPVRVIGGLAFRSVSAAGNYTCGVTTRNVAYCWGVNDLGQLGNGKIVGPEQCYGGLCSTRPDRVVGGLVFRQVDAGREHTCGVTTSDAAYCWGNNPVGQLGDGSSRGPKPRPVPVSGSLAFRQVNAGGSHTCGVTTSGAAYCWGANFSGQLGNGNSAGPEECFGPVPCSTRPVRVIRGLTFGRVKTGGAHTCGVTIEQVAYCWGSNLSGELGHGTTTGPEICGNSPFGVPCSTRPVRVVRGLAFSQVSAGAGYGCGVATGNAAYCWGLNKLGQLGIGKTIGPESCPGGPCSTRPVAVALPARP